MNAIDTMEWSALKTMAIEDGWGILGDKIAIYKKASNELFRGQLLKVENPSTDAQKDKSGSEGQQTEKPEYSDCQHWLSDCSCAIHPERIPENDCQYCVCWGVKAVI